MQHVFALLVLECFLWLDEAFVFVLLELTLFLQSLGDTAADKTEIGENLLGHEMLGQQFIQTPWF